MAQSYKLQIEKGIETNGLVYIDGDTASPKYAVLPVSTKNLSNDAWRNVRRYMQMGLQIMQEERPNEFIEE